jgi:hypothetical protein
LAFDVGDAQPLRQIVGLHLLLTARGLLQDGISIGSRESFAAHSPGALDDGTDRVLGLGVEPDPSN